MQNIELKRIKAYEDAMELRVSEQVPLLQYKAFENIEFIRHGFSTRQGGVSGGIYSSMNFKEDGEDSSENIRENYRRIAGALGCDVRKMVRAQLCHGVRVHKVEPEDFGVGAMEKSTLLDYDGLITDLDGVTLVATFADCVPLYFVDPKHRAVGLAHSGWRGTAGRIALHMIEAMMLNFGTEAKDLQVAIGPCICGECYEVGAELREAFEKDFSGEVESQTGILFEDICKSMPKTGELEQTDESEQADKTAGMKTSDGVKLSGKYYLNLRQANMMTLLAAGVPREQIEVSDICTCCNPEVIFSHRFSKGRRGASAAFLGIKE